MGDPGKRFKKSYTKAYQLEIAKEIDRKAGDFESIARLRQIHVTTAQGWYMKLKTYGEQYFVERPKKEKRIAMKAVLSDLSNVIEDLSRRIKTLESVAHRHEAR